MPPSWHQLTPEGKLSLALQKNHAAGANKPWKGRFHESLMKGVRFVSFDSGSSKNKNNDKGDNNNSSNPKAAPTTNNSPPTLVLSFPVTKNLCNDFDTLHGGAQATAIDLFTSILLDLVNPVPSVTTDLHVSCIGPVPLGSTVVCLCKAHKHGGSLQYSSCELYREVPAADDTRKRRVVVAKGLHTKYVVKKRTKGFKGSAEASGAVKLPSKL